MSNWVLSPSLKIGITLAILSLSGKIPVANIWFVISFNFISAGFTNFNNREEMPTYPTIVFDAYYILFWKLFLRQNVQN